MMSNVYERLFYVMVKDYQDLQKKYEEASKFRDSLENEVRENDRLLGEIGFRNITELIESYKNEKIDPKGDSGDKI